VYLTDFYEQTESLLTDIRESQAGAIHRGGVVIAASMAQKGAVYILDTGHLLRHEAFRRAGGLLAFRPLAYDFQVEHAPFSRPVDRSKQEEEELVARKISVALDMAGVRFGDVAIFNSNSGRNDEVVEMAIQCNKRGLATIGIASSAQMNHLDALHPGGHKIVDAVDIFIDNCGPLGDAMVSVTNNENMCPASGMAAAYILWALQAEAVQNLQDRGTNPSIYLSVHLGGEEFMEQQEQKFKELGI